MNGYRNKIIFFICCMFSLFPVHAEIIDTELFEQANAAYQAQQYEESVRLYSQIVENGNEGALLFYNLGNAYFKTGDKARALLWYERAFRLSPSNDDIKHNIAFVNQTLVDKMDVMPQFLLSKWWNSLSMRMTSTSWAIFSIICLFLLIAFIASLTLVKKSGARSTLLVVSIICFLLLVFSIIFARKEQTRYEKYPEAIIMTNVVTVKSSPDSSGTGLFVIHEGIKVTISERMSDWYEIKLPNGEKGWIESKDLEII